MPSINNNQSEEETKSAIAHLSDTELIERIFTGFALDGKLISAGYFGNNPIILGIESPGVIILQNSALTRKQWLPVIQLY